MYRVCYKNKNVQYWMYVNDLSEVEGKDVVGIHEFNPNIRWKSFTAEELRLLLKTGSLTTEREVEGRGRLNAEISYELDCRKHP